jgi:hypothetical protein
VDPPVVERAGKQKCPPVIADRMPRIAVALRPSAVLRSGAGASRSPPKTGWRPLVLRALRRWTRIVLW